MMNTKESTQNIEQEAKEAVRWILKSWLKAGYQAIGWHPYTDKDGNFLYAKARIKHPKKDGKVITPISQKPDGSGFVNREPPFEMGKKPLYRLHKLVAANPDAAVFVVEGENCVEALEGIGELATTSGGANSANSVDWTPLAKRKVAIWPDNDTAGRMYANQVSQILLQLGCDVSIVDVDKIGVPERGDFVDWIKSMEAHDAKR